MVAELVFGVERSAVSHQANNRLRVDQLRQQFVSISFHDLAAEQCGFLRAHLASLGMPIGPNDLMIASIALAHNLILVTNNTSEFSRVPGLLVEDWQ